MNITGSVDKLQIVTYPDPVLRKRCAPVETFDAQLEALVERMEQLLKLYQGVGLAAPQVGVPIRLFICNPSGEPDDTTVWINPELSDLDGAEEAEEGCLSIPNVMVPKRRAVSVVIAGCNVKGEPVRAEGAGLLARIWQHETDHLDGKLIIDAMPEAAKIANRKTLKQLEADYAAAARK